MGLKITSTLHTSKGDTNEMYLNIDNIMLVKNYKESVRVNKYLNKATRDANVNNKCDCYEIQNNYQFDLPTSATTATNIYDVMYTALKAELTTKGLTVVDEN